MNKELREYVKFLKRYGYIVTDIRYGKHVKLIINNSFSIIASKTPSCNRARKNSLSFLRRKEATV